MAELNVFANNLQRELTCSICEEIFTNPRTLKCLHSFCLQCISDWNASCRRERRPLTCPSCRSVERLEGNDVSNLPPSFYLDSLLQLLQDVRISAQTQHQQELPSCVSCKKQGKLVAFCPQCNGLICAACVSLHQTLTLFEEHQATMFSDFKKENVKSYFKNRIYCPKKHHNNNKLDFYCTTCNECICLTCNATEHKLHDAVTVEEAAEEVKASIKLGMDQVNKVKERYKEELTVSKQNVARIEQEINASIKKVSDEVEQHIKILRDHETAVIETLQRKLQQLKGQNDEEQREIRDGIESISEFNLRGQTLLDENVAHFIVKSQQELSQRCETLLEKSSILSCKPLERNASVRYTPNPQVTQALQDIGKVEESVIDPSRCFIEKLNDIWRGFEVVIRNSQNELCVTNQGLVDIQIQDSDGINLEKEMSQCETGKYTVTYRAGKPCDYTIHVKICGQEIKNSPQTVKTLDLKDAFKLVKTFGSKGNGRGQLHNPWSLAFCDNGEVAVADCSNHRVVIFSADGEYLRHFGEKGAGDGLLTGPRAVVFNGDRLLVTDNTNDTGRLQEFNLNGTYCKTIYKQQEVGLRGMCIANENIAVCCIALDKEKSKSGIKVFNKQSGQLVQEIHSDEKPTNIAYDKGKYFVSYSYNHYVRVFDVKGDFLYKFGEEGNRNGQFKHPRGLAVVSDVVLVCDDGNGRIQMFSQDGRFISSFGSNRTGLGTGQMKEPMDIAIAADGRVFVVEWKNSRVQVWR